MSAYLERAAALMASKQLELETKGYSPRLARAAVDRARGSAEQKTMPVSQAIREQAFLDILTAELRQAEGWCSRELHGITAR